MYNNVDEATALGHLTSEEDHSGNEEIPAPGNVYKWHQTHVTTKYTGTGLCCMCGAPISHICCSTCTDNKEAECEAVQIPSTTTRKFSERFMPQ